MFTACRTGPDLGEKGVTLDLKGCAAGQHRWSMASGRGSPYSAQFRYPPPPVPLQRVHPPERKIRK